jgi:hypothetical protein
MRRWLTASVEAASHVSDRWALWLPGALAWMVTVGWLALIVGVARPATEAELTFMGAAIFTSGTWPWNGIAIVVAGLLVAGAAIALASLAEAVLLHGRLARTAHVGAIFAIGVACAIPLLVATAALGSALVPIAPGEFNDPNASEGEALLRTLLALSPFAVAMVLASVLGATFHAAAIRAPRDPDGIRHSLAMAPAALRRAGTAAVAQVLALLLARIGYLVLAAILLRVLWDPIDDRLGSEGFGVAAVLLLVGFVAIWLCLVLAGGALHAWGSVSWTRLLDARGREAGAVEQMESRSRP